MAVDDPKIVDFVSVDAKGTQAILTISDHLHREDGYEHQLILQQKLNTYLLFVESGELIERFPSTKGLPVVFDIRFMHEPDESGLRFLERASEVVVSVGFSFRYKTLASSQLH
jgi:hypothetical protein